MHMKGHQRQTLAKVKAVYLCTHIYFTYITVHINVIMSQNHGVRFVISNLSALPTRFIVCPTGKENSKCFSNTLEYFIYEYIHDKYVSLVFCPFVSRKQYVIYVTLLNTPAWYEIEKHKNDNQKIIIMVLYIRFITAQGNVGNFS